MRVHCVRVRNVDQYRESFHVDVTVCKEHGFDARVACFVIREVPDVCTLPLHNIHHPAHVVPYCVRSASEDELGAAPACRVQAIFDPPSGFNPPCFGLRGSHATNDLYVVNPYFIK